MTTWILVADESRARLFEASNAGAALVEREDFVHVQGRQHAHDVLAERLPRTHDSMGSSRHAIEPRTELEDIEAARFARELVAVLEHGRVGGQYARLLLVAPPRFLGVLRATLPHGVEALVAGSVAKEVTLESAEAIRARIEALL